MEIKKFKKKSWQDVRVGDIVRIKKNEYIPADLLLLQSSDPKGQAFIETKNLDGETNLKHRTAPKAILNEFKPEKADDEVIISFCIDLPSLITMAK
jgi:P-type E1-E2 ATPase